MTINPVRSAPQVLSSSTSRTIAASQTFPPIVVAASAGDGFIRHMQKRGAQVLLTGEREPDQALARILTGEALPETRFDITTTLCKLRDLFARH